MKKSTKGLILSLAAVMILSPVAVKAGKAGKDIIDAVPISAPAELDPELIISPVSDVKITEYIEFKGKIVKINNVDGRISIEVRNDNKDGLDAMIAYLDDDVMLLSREKMDFAEVDTLEEGMEVSIIYHKDTIMAMSYPPQMGPDVVVINDEEDHISIMVSKFDKELLNTEKDMYIRISDEAILIDKDGNKVEKEDLIDKDLVVFYNVVRESYPAQASPEKVIVLPERESQVIEVKEIFLKDELIKNEEGTIMIPLRIVSEALGYEVTWNQETKTAELVRGSIWSAVTIGEDKYNYARMYIELGTAPILQDSTTYVPVNFAEQVLLAQVELLEDGSIRIFE